MSDDRRLDELKARCGELGLRILAEIDTEISGWQPGVILDERFGSKKLDPLREDYGVAPGGTQTIVELRRPA